jgi:DNA-binding transcriptional LysR family regulator
MKPYELADLQLRHLLALQAISEEGSFWAAAERLGCSQAALSQQLATLERVLGTKLVDRSRGRRSISMTEAGTLLLHHAHVIVARLRAVHADFSAFAEGAAGTLRIGTFESTGTRILPRLLGEFHRLWPGVKVQLTEVAKDDALLKLVEQGDLDLCFAIYPLPEGPFEAKELFHDPYVVAVAANSRFAFRGAPPRLKDLRDVPIATFGQGRSVDQVESFLGSRGIKLNVVFRSNYNGSVQGFAAAGGSVALAPLLTMDARNPDTRIVGPVADLPPRVIGIAWHRDRYRSPVARAFVEFAEAFCKRMSPKAEPARKAGNRKT